MKHRRSGLVFVLLPCRRWPALTPHVVLVLEPAADRIASLSLTQAQIDVPHTFDFVELIMSKARHSHDSTHSFIHSFFHWLCFASVCLRVCLLLLCCQLHSLHLAFVSAFCFCSERISAAPRSMPAHIPNVAFSVFSGRFCRLRSRV